MADDVSTASFLKSKFDNLSLIFLVVFLICLLTWVDKHGNGDYEKWLEVFTAGVGGAYLGMITGSRQSWKNPSPPAIPNSNGGNNNDKVQVPPSASSAPIAAGPAPGGV